MGTTAKTATGGIMCTEALANAYKYGQRYGSGTVTDFLLSKLPPFYAFGHALFLWITFRGGGTESPPKGRKVNGTTISHKQYHAAVGSRSRGPRGDCGMRYGARPQNWTKG